MNARPPTSDAAATALPSAALRPRDVAPINRELSLLAFHRRVLALAADPATPILERLRFLCIVGSNLDEFFEIRVAGLKHRLSPDGPSARRPSRDELRRLLVGIARETRALVADQYRLLNEAVLPALAAAGVRLARYADCTPAQQAWIARYFRESVRPLLTPIALDPAHAFPQVVNKALNFIVELSGRDAFGRPSCIAIVRAPRLLPRVIKLAPEVAPANTFLLLSSIIQAFLRELFPGHDVLSYAQFRVTRDADLWLDEEEVKNLRKALQGELPQREFGSAVRLEVAASCPDHLVQLLLAEFALGADDFYRCDGPVNVVRLETLIEQVSGAALRYPDFTPGLPDRLLGESDILAAMRQHDILLHHPYQSFEPVVSLIRRAAEDPDVVAVKQTVYRTGVNSVLMEALMEASRRGKEVTVVIELRARFDEEANINWAEQLERAGAQVVHGVFGLKTHAKLALLVRREADPAGGTRLASYAHLGTGNYHPRTTRLYSDFGLLTADPEICADVNEVFLHITSLARASRLQRLLLAPFTMHRRVLQMIRNETRAARAGRPARIVAKMNGLVEERVIRALYAASRAGVRVDLVVRGACALRPGVPGVSENIRVRSLLGRFLEHHRVWHFANAPEEQQVWLSSADWMGRNLFGRIEVAFPIRDATLRERVLREGLESCFEDTAGSWELQASGEWVRCRSDAGGAPRSAQSMLLARLAAH